MSLLIYRPDCPISFDDIHNDELDSLAQNGEKADTWQFVEDYETDLRVELGDEIWQKKCQEYAEVARKSKPIYARMIASDEDAPIPEKVNDILAWLVNGDKPRLSRVEDAT